jgi:CO/xanthine dehydrogenase FAD-binding subunit
MRVHVPESVDEAVGLLGSGTLIAGGTHVVPRAEPTESLVSLRRAGLAGITVQDRTVRIGAATTLAQVGREVEFLHDAIESIASPTIRNLATVGGNLFVPQPYGDFAVCLLALDATVHVAGPDGIRQAPVGEVLDAGVGRGEVVAEVSFARPDDGTWFYHKAMRRRLNSAAIVAVAAVVHTSGGIVTSARIALGGVAPRPVRAVSAERVLVGRPLDVATLDEAGAAARADITPFDDAYASAWYRTRVLPVHLRRAILG